MCEKGGLRVCSVAACKTFVAAKYRLQDQVYEPFYLVVKELKSEKENERMRRKVLSFLGRQESSLG
jgi:hypothetical protein